MKLAWTFCFTGSLVRSVWLHCCLICFSTVSFAQEWEHLDRNFGFNSSQTEIFNRILSAGESDNWEEAVLLSKKLREGDDVTTDVQIISHQLEGALSMKWVFRRNKQANPPGTRLEKVALPLEDIATLKRAAAASHKCKEMALREKERTGHKKYDSVIAWAAAQIANAAYYNKEYDKAMKLNREIMELYPLSSAARIAVSKLHNCYKILDRYEECISILEGHIENNPKTEGSLGALILLEHHYRGNRDYEKALEINRRIVADYHNFPYRDRIEQQIKWLEENKGKTLPETDSCFESHSPEKIPAIIKTPRHEGRQRSEGDCGCGCGKGKEQSSEQPSPIKGSCSCGTPRSSDYTPAKNITDH